MNYKKILQLSAAAIACVGFPLCGHAAEPDLVAAPVVSTSGRLLASSCFQCHSSSGFEGITGESPSELISELNEMRARRVPESIMDLVARGLTDAQIREIAAYLATLPETKGND